MSPGYRFHPGTRLVLLQGAGQLSLDDWENAAREVLVQPAWRGTRRILSDRRRMEGGFPRGMEERALSFFHQNAEALGAVQWAVVLADDKGAIQTVRIAAELAKNTRVRVQGFTDIAVALHWMLGAYPEDQIAALTRWIDDDE